MGFRVYNTMSRSIEELIPIENHYVRMYTCGPTIYNYAHIGNFRSYMFEDLLRRYLKFRGFEVTQVMNLTDVDDKTIAASRELGIPLKEYTRKFADAFFEDIDTLRIERAEHYPAATDHIADMIALIQRLLDTGYAYRSEDGSVYYRISKFANYGRLARLDISGMKAGARVSQDEYQKDDLADFALWKAWDESDAGVVWDAPWGRGRPGWHIECSAMAMRYLGESFDLHTGGVDNIFPHHEDEIAQSEAATGKPFVKYWMHCAHLIVDGKKMSKSLGNFYTLRDILDRGYAGREIRYVLLSTHYRQSLNFSFSALDAARASLHRLDAFRSRLEDAAGDKPHVGALPAWAAGLKERFTAGLDDDLNISEALAALFDVVHAGNRAMDEQAIEPAAAMAVMALLYDLDQVLAILESEPEQADPEVLELVALRKEARAAKNWSESDRLRDEISARGWIVQDTPDGQKLKRK